MFARISQSSLLILPVLLGFFGIIPPVIVITATGLVAAGVLAEAGISNRAVGAECATVAEMLSIGVWAAALHQVAPLGTLTLVPALSRRSRYPEAASRLVWVASAVTLFSSWAVTKGVVPTWYEWVSSAAVGLVGAMAFALTGSAPKLVAGAPTEGSRELPVALPDEERILEYREAYRRLKNVYEDLVRRSDSDRASMCLVQWRFGEGRSSRDLAQALRQAAEVEGAAIYTVPDIRDGMVLASSSGSAPAEARTLQIPIQAAPIMIREKASAALSALRTSNSTACENVILLDRGRLVGLAALYDSNPERSERGKRVLEDLSPLLARLLRDEQEAEALRIRTVRAELLADLGTRYLDSTRAEASQGICDDLLSSLRLSGCAIMQRDGANWLAAGQAGDNPNPVFEGLILGAERGLEGWALAGGRELLVPEAREDVRYDRLLAIRKGVGMLVLMPLFSGSALVGALAAWTEEAHGVSSASLGTLRSIVPHVVRRCLGAVPASKRGLVDASTFWDGAKGTGSFVEIDLGRGEGGDESSSQALMQARKKLLAAAIAQLPPGGLLTRRPSGTLVAFLAGFDEKATNAWASALVPTPDNPWGMSVKVLGHSPQSIQFLQKVFA
jgi:hypothetical protein